MERKSLLIVSVLIAAVPWQREKRESGSSRQKFMFYKSQTDQLKSYIIREHAAPPPCRLQCLKEADRDEQKHHDRLREFGANKPRESKNPTHFALPCRVGG